MRHRAGTFAAIALVTVGLGSWGASPAVGQVTVTEFKNGITAGSQPWGIVAGPDGAVWFTEYLASKVARITTAGVVTEYSSGIPAGSAPMGIAVGADGALWFAEFTGNSIGRITTAGVVTEHSSGISPGGWPAGIAAGPDGALWFTESGTSRIGKITTAGAVTEYSNGITAGSAPVGIAAGSDGALWFTESGADRIGRITTAGVVTEYSTGITPGSQPWNIAAGPDGALWFTMLNAAMIGRITTAGVVTEYSSLVFATSGIVAGPDGALWFTEPTGNKIGRITTSGVVTEYVTGITLSSAPYGIAVGPDNALWFTEFNAAQIGRASGPWLEMSRWIPAVIHKDVTSKNAKWRSDVAVLNRSASTANLTITVHAASGPLTRTTQLGPSSQLLQTDVAGWLGVTADSGPLEVVSDQAFFLSGRTYNQVDATHTYAQDYEGPMPSDLLAAGDSSNSTAWLPQLTENASYRTNIGITNTGAAAANVTLTLYNANGHQVWTDARDYQAGGFYQYQQPYLALGGIANGYAKVTVNSGSGIVAYASVTDQNTNDPTTITTKGGPSPAGLVTVNEYSTGITAGSKPAYIVSGPDGALWFTEWGGNRIGRITTAGAVTEYPTGIAPQGLAVGADGAIWFAEYNGKIGRITTSGTVKEYSNGISSGSGIMAVAAGPDGAIWFAENKRDQIGRITSSGTVTEYSNGITSGSAPYGIVAGPDGALWFTEPTGNQIGRITTGGSVTEYSTGITAGSQPLGITVGPDGALWFTEWLGSRIGRITTGGVVTEYASGIMASCRPHEIVTGPDGALWFAETVGNKIGRITTAGVVTEYATGITPGAGLYGMVVGSDDAIWFTEFYKDHVGRVEGPWMPSSRWIPAVIHKDVPSKNAKWRSDVAVLNRSTSTANLTIAMYPAAGPVSRTTQVGAQSQLLQTDIAGWLGVTTDSGPLEVTSDQDFFLSGRTYNQVDATHTYGQDYDGPKPSELLAAGDSAFSTAWLPQLTENALYRTNIGITNTGTTTANVTVTLYDASGNQVWTDSRDYAAGGFYQYQQPYLAHGGIANGYAEVTVNSGSGVVAYASVTDQQTNDPTTITMKR